MGVSGLFASLAFCEGGFSIWLDDCVGPVIACLGLPAPRLFPRLAKVFQSLVQMGCAYPVVVGQAASAVSVP